MTEGKGEKFFAPTIYPRRSCAMNPTYPIIDADGHVLEKDRELHDYLGGR